MPTTGSGLANRWSCSRVRCGSTTIRVHEVVGDEVRFSVRCSSGTYVRAVARDLGEWLGTGGHLTALRRTAVGPFTLDGAHTLDQLESEFATLGMEEAVRLSFPARELDEAQAVDVGFGRKLSIDLGQPGPVGPSGSMAASWPSTPRRVSARAPSRCSSTRRTGSHKDGNPRR